MLASRISCVAIALLSVVACRAEEPSPGPDYDHLKAMEWMIGDWEGSWKVEAGGLLASAFPSGATVHSYSSYAWMQNKNYIGQRFRDEVEGKTVHEGFEMIGYDSKSKKTVHWLYSVLGGAGVGEWSVKDNVWQLKWSYTSGDGTELKGVSYLNPIDENTHTWQAKDLTENGKKVPDTPVVTLRRVAGAYSDKLETATAAEFEEFGNKVVGRWVDDITLIADWPGLKKKRGDKMVGYTTVRWAAGKKAIISNSVGGETTGLGLWTHDPISKKINVKIVDSAGSVLDAVVWKESEDKWAFRMTGSIADGRKQKGSGYIVFSDGGKTQTLSSNNMTLDGEGIGELNDVSHRLGD